MSQFVFSSFKVTRSKDVDLAKKQTSRTVFRCNVIGPPGSGRVGIVHHYKESFLSCCMEWFITVTHVKISQLVNKMCSQQACSKLVNKLYNNVVILSSCYKVVTRNLSTRCVHNRLVASMSTSCITMLLFYQVATRLSLATCQQDVFATGL